MKERFQILGVVLIALLAPAANGQAQAVSVTLELDTSVVAVGGGTMLRVHARIAPELRPDAERIFSWHVDVLNSNAAVAQAGYGALQKTASDNDPQLSSTGFNDGPDRRGIYDTFLEWPGAGRDAPVELLRMPVMGLAEGRARFSVRAGSGAPGLDVDFIVAAAGGGEPWTGGDYSMADVELEVAETACELRLTLEPDSGWPAQFWLSFVPCPGYDHTVEYRDDLNPGANWEALPGAPHNTGGVLVGAGGSGRFYRVRAEQTIGAAHAR